MLVANPLIDGEAPPVPAFCFVKLPPFLGNNPQLVESTGLSLLITDPLFNGETPTVPAFRFVKLPPLLGNQPQLVQTNCHVAFVFTAFIMLFELSVNLNDPIIR